MVTVRYVFAVLLTVALLGLIGIALYFGAVKPFLRQSGLNWVMSTIGFSIIVQNGALAFWGPSPIAMPSPLGEGVIRAFGIGIKAAGDSRRSDRCCGHDQSRSRACALPTR